MTREIGVLLSFVAADSEEERMKAIQEAKVILAESGGVKAEMPLKRRIENLLIHLGIPPVLKGFKYIVCAIQLCLENDTYLDRITSALYPDIGNKYGNTASGVERSIRHAVEVAWDRGDLDVLQKMFGNTVSFNKGKPTNGEFLARLVMEFE